MTLLFFLLIQLALIAGFGWVVVTVVRRLFGSSDDPRKVGPAGQRGRWVGLDEKNATQTLPPGEPSLRSRTIEIDARTIDQQPIQPTHSHTQHLSPKQQREARLAELRRRYVEDEITVEEYEAELDKLLRE